MPEYVYINGLPPVTVPIGKDLIETQEVGSPLQTKFITKENLLSTPAETPSFENSWVNYDNGYDPALYYKDSSGIVHLQGMIKSGTVTTAAFTLPVGYRPIKAVICRGYSNSSSATRIDILINGSVWMHTVSNNWATLEGISFLAEQ